MLGTLSPQVVPSRAAGLDRLAAFAPRMGARYARERNHDHGAGRHVGVSCLSPWVRRRLVTERELVETALARHAASSAEKFVQEVVWRTYFKGWLEGRPCVWADYRAGLDTDLDEVAADSGLSRRLAAAEEGRTGLDCFDAWAAELVETGYLHNHARMWFASIWIFTLGLPWRVGADFFLRHLLDGDPASNTLGWRWVAGLHTRGKAYAARASNIARFTGGRFTPDPGDLGPAVALEEEVPPPPAAPPRLPAPPEHDVRSVLLLHEDDCCVEDLIAAPAGLAGLGLMAATGGRSPREVAQPVADFDAGALHDAAARLAAAGAPEAKPLRGDDPAALADWAAAHGAGQIVTPYAPVGPVRDALDRAEPALARAGIRLAEIRRDWDSLVWPHATAGFFKVKKQIPRLLSELGVTG